MKKYPLISSVLAFVFIFTIIDIVTKDKKYSQQENRILASKPNLNMKNLKDGSFSKKYESYVNDQFLFRDKWIDIKSIGEFILGKKENNNIVYGKDGYMFEKIQSINIEGLCKNIEAINNFINKNHNEKSKVNFMIIPSSYSILKEKVPYGLNMIDELKYINKIYESINENNIVNIIDILESNKNQYIYYKTDHHWTIKGAMLAYKKILNHIGEQPISFENYKINKIENFLGSYYAKSKDFKAKKDYIEFFELNNLMMKLDTGTEYNSIYDYSKINSVDKYAFFLYGNNGLSIIKNENLKNNKKLLVIKDSFANSLIPLLTEHFEEIHVVDLRYTSLKLSEYIQNNNFENIFILYNFLNLCNDINVLKVKY